MHGLRAEFQERVNFVILDYDSDEDLDLARDLGIARHPAFGVIEPNSDTVSDRRFGPIPPEALRELLEEIAASFAGASETESGSAS